MREISNLDVKLVSCQAELRSKKSLYQSDMVYLKYHETKEAVSSTAENVTRLNQAIKEAQIYISLPAL
jgi:hypothetical protein